MRTLRFISSRGNRARLTEKRITGTNQSRYVEVEYTQPTIKFTAESGYLDCKKMVIEHTDMTRIIKPIQPKLP